MNEQSIAGAHGLTTSRTPPATHRQILTRALAILGGGILVTLPLLLPRTSSDPLSGLAVIVVFGGLLIMLYASHLACVACQGRQSHAPASSPGHDGPPDRASLPDHAAQDVDVTRHTPAWLARVASRIEAPLDGRHPEAKTHCRFIDVVQVLAVSLVVTAAYVHALGVGFLADDFNFLGPSSWQQLATGFFPVGGQSFYRPLEQMLWAVDYYLYATNPVGYHVTNGLLLTLSAALVYILAVLMLRHRFAAMIAALLYGLHPLHVQATVWIAGRPSLLVTVFFVLAVIGYVFGQSRPRMRWLSWLAAALALMSKESATTLPAVIALTYVVCRPLPVRAHTAMRHDAMNQTEPTAALARLSWRSWAFGLLRDVAPYLGIVIAYLMFRVVVIGELRPYYQGSYTDWPVVSNNLATAIKMLGIPWTQPDPATPFVTRQAWGWVLAFAGLLMLTLAWARARLVFWGMGWFLVTYGLLVNVRYVQERFFDLPLVGVAIAVAAVLLLLGQTVAVQDRRVRTITAVLCVLAVASIATLYLQSVRTRTTVFYRAAELVSGPAEQIKRWYPDLPAHAHITILGVPTWIGDYFNLAYSWGVGRQLRSLYPPEGPRIDVAAHRDVAALVASQPPGTEDHFFVVEQNGQVIDLSPDITPHHIRFVESQDAPGQPSYQRLSAGESLRVSLLLDPAVNDEVWLRYRTRDDARVGLGVHNSRGQCQADWSNAGDTWTEQRLALPSTVEQGRQVTLTLSNLGPAGVVDISEIALQAPGTEVPQSTCVSP